eukprot:COSAG01_NODE_12123_length_1797_cov_26.290342_2_plen_119_part_01
MQQRWQQPRVPSPGFVVRRRCGPAVPAPSSYEDPGDGTRGFVVRRRRSRTAAATETAQPFPALVRTAGAVSQGLYLIPRDFRSTSTVRRSIDNVVKTKIIPVIEANCWEFQWCIALREF